MVTPTHHVRKVQAKTGRVSPQPKTTPRAAPSVTPVRSVCAKGSLAILLIISISSKPFRHHTPEPRSHAAYRRHHQALTSASSSYTSTERGRRSTGGFRPQCRAAFNQRTGCGLARRDRHVTLLVEVGIRERRDQLAARFGAVEIDAQIGQRVGRDLLNDVGLSRT